MYFYNESILVGLHKKEGITYYINKRSKGFELTIVPIVIASIVCIGALIAILIILRKQYINKSNLEESTKKVL